MRVSIVTGAPPYIFEPLLCVLRRAQVWRCMSDGIMLSGAESAPGDRATTATMLRASFGDQMVRDGVSARPRGEHHSPLGEHCSIVMVGCVADLRHLMSLLRAPGNAGYVVGVFRAAAMIPAALIAAGVPIRWTMPRIASPVRVATHLGIHADHVRAIMLTPCSRAAAWLRVQHRTERDAYSVEMESMWVARVAWAARLVHVLHTWARRARRRVAAARFLQAAAKEALYNPDTRLGCAWTGRLARSFAAACRNR
jgi:hypothetical protein